MSIQYSDFRDSGIKKLAIYPAIRFTDNAGYIANRILETGY
jgi:hypothetical protein